MVPKFIATVFADVEGTVTGADVGKTLYRCPEGRVTLAQCDDATGAEHSVVGVVVVVVGRRIRVVI